MLPGHYEYLEYLIRVSRHRVREMICEAEQNRLVREARAAAPRHSRRGRRVAAWIGALMDRLGLGLQHDDPSARACCEEAGRHG
jgi:hypothetical protein